MTIVSVAAGAGVGGAARHSPQPPFDNVERSWEIACPQATTISIWSLPSSLGCAYRDG